ncbi:MAG: Phage packaging protein Nu1 [Pseudomonadota bacterium]|jgi:phage terminase Nu1 subunit (DNA packaging protein)
MADADYTAAAGHRFAQLPLQLPQGPEDAQTMAHRKPADVELGALNQQQAAALLGVTARSLRDWADAPRNGDGTYDGPMLVQWYVARERGLIGEYDTQRERLAAAQAEKVEAENAVRRGELAELSAVAEQWSAHIHAARAKLLSMPAKLGPQLTHVADPTVIAARIRAEVYAALVELGGTDDDDTDTETAARDRRRARAPRARAQVVEPAA